jgi:hypothetical protein
MVKILATQISRPQILKFISRRGVGKVMCEAAKHCVVLTAVSG